MTVAVYCITNNRNGKKYIGGSTFLEMRIEKHFSELRSGTHHSKKMQEDFTNGDGLDFAYYVLQKIEWESGQRVAARRAVLKAEKNWIRVLSPEYNTHNVIKAISAAV